MPVVLISASISSEYKESFVNLVEIEAKKSVLLSALKAATAEANLALQPLQVQIQQLEGEAHKIVLGATQKISHLNGQISILDEMAAGLRPDAGPPPA